MKIFGKLNQSINLYRCLKRRGDVVLKTFILESLRITLHPVYNVPTIYFKVSQMKTEMSFS